MLSLLLVDFKILSIFYVEYHIIHFELSLLISLTVFSYSSTFLQVVGGSCGQHGSCTFFKGLRVVLPTITTTTTSNNNNNNNNTSSTTLTTVATSRLSLNNNNANNKQNNSIKSKDCNNKTLNNSTNGNNLNGKRGAGISSVSSDVSDNDNKLLNGNESCESNKICEVITCDKSNEMKREPLELKGVEEM